MQVSFQEIVRFAKHPFFPLPSYFLPSIILMMSLLALSTDEVSSDCRYMSVVFSESCPIALLMVDRGTLLVCAILAHAWRAT